MTSITTTVNTKVTAVLIGCTVGAFLAVLATASPAGADPGDPVTPGPVAVGPVAVGPPAGPVVPDSVPPAPVLGSVPGPPASAPTVQAADTNAVPVPMNGVPHLASPDALPPGSTMQPQDVDSPNVSYLKDLWQAVQDHQISGKEALVMGLAQRGMNTPYPTQAAGPNVPLGPRDSTQLPAPAPAPADPAPMPPTQ